VESLSSINTSNQSSGIWFWASRKTPLRPHACPLWVDVRDLALAHVEAAYIRPETSNKRFVVCSPEKSSYQHAAQIIKEEFPEWAEKVALPPGGPPPAHISLDGSPLTKELGIKYTSLRECIVAVVKQLRDEAVKEGLLEL
jgi:nucleoside-diphosphate-sugar epimerase